MEPPKVELPGLFNSIGELETESVLDEVVASQKCRKRWGVATHERAVLGLLEKSGRDMLQKCILVVNGKGLALVDPRHRRGVLRVGSVFQHRIKLVRELDRERHVGSKV